MRNHARELWACDFLNQYTALFTVAYVFVVMEIASRRVVLANVTTSPTLAWVKQQIRQATPDDSNAAAFMQYGGDASQPDYTGGIAWSMKSADLSVVLGVDFWAPFRHLTPRFPGYVLLQVGTRVRHVVEHSLTDLRGTVFFQETPGAGWGLWAGLAVGVLFNRDAI